jgi:Tfp pilus assembly protein PilN
LTGVSFRNTAVLLLCLATVTPVAAQECVILLHGLWRSDHSMNRMEESLVAAGYWVQNTAYDSTEKTVEQLAEEAVATGLDGCEGAKTFHSTRSCHNPCRVRTTARFPSIRRA